ncbi:hypothetical protein ACQ4PT_005868 [Festuca glaucescens]
MAGKAPAQSRGAAPPPNFTLRRPIIPRSTPGREGREPGAAGERNSVGDNVDAGVAVVTAAAAGTVDSVAARNAQVAQQQPSFQCAPSAAARTAQGAQLQPSFQSSHFEAGGTGRFGDGRRNDFADQDYGDFQEGFYEGNNGYGNGYGSHARGNFRQRPYNNYRQQWNRNFNNNYRGSGRFNNSNNRYQRRFNNNENLQVETLSQKADTTQLVVPASGEGATSASSHQMDTSSLENLVLPLSSRAQKKIDKMQCLKCGEFGHFADACTAVLCLYCEKISHESKDCPLLFMPKPVAITYGSLGGVLRRLKSLVSSNGLSQEITSGILSLPMTVLLRFFFPSKADLARMTKIINVPVPGTTMFLLFEEWSAADLDKFDLSPVWVRVHDCCYKERCDYLSLFGVGSLIGKTKEVDMAYTRAHSDLRMLVEVTRVEFIPKTTVDHTYAGQGYGLIFKLETDHSKDKSDVEMHEVTPDDDSKKEEGTGHEKSTDGDFTPGGDAKMQTPKPAPSKQNLSSKQAAALSLPVLRVGLIDCPSHDNHDVRCWSESKTTEMYPRKLWGDCEDDEEDNLPSPLPRLHDFYNGDEVSASGISEACSIEKRAVIPAMAADSTEKRLVFPPATAGSAEKREVFPAVAAGSAEKRVGVPAAAAGSAEMRAVLPAAAAGSAVKRAESPFAATGTAEKSVLAHSVQGQPRQESSCSSVCSQGITPYINLYHADIPLALEKKYGGWLSAKTV